jgi:hypothetical protein
MKFPALCRPLALLMTFCVAAMPFAQNAEAAIISTDTAIEMAELNRQVERVNEFLARESVRTALTEMGVDPQDAMLRVQSLTAEELRVLDERLAELPAGGTGVVEVVGIVAIVLIVLELLNVTNFFTEF